MVIEGVKPEIDCGRFPIKRTIGDLVQVEADIFADGHEVISGVLLHRREGQADWSEVAMTHRDNDRWYGEFPVKEIGRYYYTIAAWVDRFKSWTRDLARRLEAGQELAVELMNGATLVEAAARRAPVAEASRLAEYASTIRQGGTEAVSRALSPELADLMYRFADRPFMSVYDKELAVVVDRKLAVFGAWYEMFPRSASILPGQHGTFRDVEARLGYIAGMGFDVLYLPPIHPIGITNRKGRNNATAAGPDDPGSPWAIGAAEGGHRAIHPQLGTLDDFRRLVGKAREMGVEIAIDLAFNCTPDHPYVREHPEWFRHRPDGTIQYSENPPKKYQDIYPFDFESNSWRELWKELKEVVRFWIGQGVYIFRVDNPHTKPFSFWEWLITEIKREHPETIFLSEAFTRPKVMCRLAKLGFTQSYTYFAWRNRKQELIEYLTELTRTEVNEYFRPNFWPNTPDILSEYLQAGGRPAFIIRLVLAATLGASYGIYGPAYELCINQPLTPGQEEYLDSEKYEIKCWDWEYPGSIKDVIAQVNRIRRHHPALHTSRGLRFHQVDNGQLIAYSKATPDLGDINLDYNHPQCGWLELPLEELKIDSHQPFEVQDLLSGEQYRWQGSRNFVRLDPRALPAHILCLRHPA